MKRLTKTYIRKYNSLI